MQTETTTPSPLLRTVSTTATDYWNDSCAVDELEYAIANGAVGATSNPPIVLEVLKKEPERWKARAREIYAAFPTWSEADISWQIVEEMAVRGLKLLEPIYERTGGAKGRLSIQTNPTLYRDTPAMVAQAVHFASLAPNVQVKLPVTVAGLAAIEEATHRGVNINATVNFTVPGSIAVGEAVERGLARREADGLDVDSMHPVCTIMVGRLDDWMKAVCERDDIIVTPGYADWAGVAVFKRAYAIFRERGYRARLLSAAYRHHLHWSQLIGGDVILTMPHQWQVRFNGSAVEVRPRIDEPVAPAIVEELATRIPDFRRAYEPDGMTIPELETYPAAVRTLRQFIAAYHDLQGTIRDFVLPNPDKKAS